MTSAKGMDGLTARGEGFRVIRAQVEGEGAGMAERTQRSRLEAATGRKGKKKPKNRARTRRIQRVTGGRMGLWEASLPSFRAATSITIVNGPGQFSKGKQLLDALS